MLKLIFLILFLQSEIIYFKINTRKSVGFIIPKSMRYLLST